MTPQDIFIAWTQANDALKELKARELELRKQVAEIYFPDAASEGTTTLDIGEGWKLKLLNRTNRTLENDKGETEAIMQQLPPEVATAVFAWKPSLNVRNYRMLAPEHRALVDSVVTSKPGTPTLTLEAPKEAK